MLIETIVWLCVSLIIAIMSDIAQKYFSKNKALQSQITELQDIKSKKYKSLDEQMRYVRGRSDMGKDFVTTIASTVLFIFGYYLMIYPRIPNLYVGLGTTLVFALIFAWVSAKNFKSNKFFDFNFVTAYISYTYGGLFLVYIKFVETIHPILLLLCGIVVMVCYGYIAKKMVGDKIVA